MTDGSMKSLNDHVIFFPIYEDYQTKFEKVNVRGVYTICFFINLIIILVLIKQHTK